ncbi:MAG: helix-turn-helix transcriptional regulator [Cetobacterium sp.]
MNRNDIRNVLQYPIKSIVNDILDKANLKIAERKALELVDMLGLTEEEAAKEMDIGSRTIQKYRRNAYTKLSFIFDNSDVLEMLK